MEQRYIDLFDRYTHGQMKRRDFLERLAVLAGSTTAAAALLPMLENNYAMAEMVPESDTRIAAETITYDSPVGKVSGYLVRPKQSAKAGGVIVISENRGLNPHIQGCGAQARRRRLPGAGARLSEHQGGNPRGCRQGTRDDRHADARRDSRHFPRQPGDPCGTSR